MLAEGGRCRDGQCADERVLGFCADLFLSWIWRRFVLPADGGQAAFEEIKEKVDVEEHGPEFWGL